MTGALLAGLSRATAAGKEVLEATVHPGVIDPSSATTRAIPPAVCDGAGCSESALYWDTL